MKKLGLAIFITVFILLGVASAAQFEADVRMEGSGMEMDGKLYVMDLKARQDFDSKEAGLTITITDGEKGLVYVLMPKEKMYMEMPLQQKEFQALTAGSLEEQLEGEADVEKVGGETIEGYACDIYEIEYHDQGMGRSTVWIAQKLNYPIKVIGESSQGKISMACSNIKEGVVDQAMFEIPGDYEKFSF